MNGTIVASGRAQAATAAAVAVGFFAISLGQGAYATTAVAWGAIVLWALVGLGIVLRAWPGAITRPAAVAAACFVGLAALSLVSMAWADDAGSAFTAALLPAAYAGLLLLVVLALPLVRPRTWLAGIAGGAVLVTLLALFSRLHPGVIGGGGEATLVSIGAGGRLSYPIGYWNGLAACVATGLVLLVWLGSQAERREARAVAVALLPFGGLALFLTSSRGGALAVALGVGALIAFGPTRARLAVGAVLGAAATVPLAVLATHRYDLIHDLGTSAQRSQGAEIAFLTLAVAVVVGLVRWRMDGWLATVQVPRSVRRGVIVAAVVVGIAGVAVSDPAARLHDFTTDNPGATAVPGQRSLFATSGSGRAQFWQAALDAFASHPGGGVGAGNYDLYWNAHPKAATITGNAHSFFLEELADLGPLGLLLALGPFVVAGVAAKRGWRRAPGDVAPAVAVIATGLLGAAIDWTWKIPASFIPAVIAIGLLAGLAVRGDARGTGRARGLRAAVVITGVCVLVVGGIVVYASTQLTDSRDAVARGDLTTAIDDANSAADVEPFSPEPPLQLALVYELAKEPVRARAYAQKAIGKAPGDWRGWAVAARIDRSLNARARAAAEQARAQALTPVPLPANALSGSG